VQNTEFPVEIQLRTELQHTWAELSEKLADAVGIDTKYGGGPSAIRERLDLYSELVASFERHLDIDGLRDEPVNEHKRKIRLLMTNYMSAIRKKP
jgi:ppGpp synthetase/RelA/SpoT-type nucleotidyltranferase